MPIKNDPTAYEQPWRRNYERCGATMWLAGAAAYAAAGGLSMSGWDAAIECLSGLPPGPFFCAGLLCAGMGLLRLPQAMRLTALQQHIGGQGVSVTTIRELEGLTKEPECRDALWLGKGFVWKPEHTQRLYEIMRLDWSSLASESKESSAQALAKTVGTWFGDARGILTDHDHGHMARIEQMGQKWIHGVESSESNLWQPLEHAAGHTLIVGTTGAGKTRCFDILITQSILRGEAVLIIDPKGDADLRENARAACRACGREGDFLVFNPAFPEESIRINPLANYNEVTDLPSRIAALMGADGSNPFRDFGWLAMNQICQALYWLDKPMTLRSIRHYLEMGAEDLFLEIMDRYGPQVLGEDEYAAAVAASVERLDRYATPVKCAADVYRREIALKRPSDVVEGLISLVEHDKTHFGKMIASLIPILSKLSSGRLGILLSPDESDDDDPRPMRSMQSLVEARKVVYIGLNSLADAVVGSALGSILLADLTSVSSGRYNYAEQKPPVSIFVDEASEVVNEPFIQLLNKGRGAGFRLFVATQLFADFAAKLGSREKAQQVLGNLNNIIALRTIEPFTQEFITGRMPKTRIVRLERSQSQSVGVRDAVHHGANIGERLVEEEVPLFPRELLGALPGLEFIGVVSGGHVIKSRIPILMSEPMAKS